MIHAVSSILFTWPKSELLRTIFCLLGWFCLMAALISEQISSSWNAEVMDVPLSFSPVESFLVASLAT